MDEYADIYYVDENRNATRVTDHRTPSAGGASSGIRPHSQAPMRTIYVANPQTRPIAHAQPTPVVYASPA